MSLAGEESDGHSGGEELDLLSFDGDGATLDSLVEDEESNMELLPLPPLQPKMESPRKVSLCSRGGRRL